MIDDDDHPTGVFTELKLIRFWSRSELEIETPTPMTLDEIQIYVSESGYPGFELIGVR